MSPSTHVQFGSSQLKSADFTRANLAGAIIGPDTPFGGANLDGEFNSKDFIEVFLIGAYEDTIDDNSGWADGDWDGDGDFTSGDFVIAFLDGGYELGPRPAAAVPEPSAFLLTALALLTLATTLRKPTAQDCA